MMTLEEAKTLFDKEPSENMANIYHRAVWRAYLGSLITYEAFMEHMRHIEAYEIAVGMMGAANALFQ